MKILICNAGSTSLKFKLYEMPQDQVIAQGKVERVGSRDDAVFQYENLLSGEKIHTGKDCIPDYRFGIEKFLTYLTSKEYGVIGDISEIERVGFKATLSKGYYGTHELTDDVMEGMRQWLPIAPVHNRAYIQAIEVMRGVLPEALFIGCFETAFHRDIPLARKIYGVPYEWYEKYGLQRLGYHGASHGYIADVLGKRTGGTYKAISCHLGGSASVCAIENGVSVDTSFGMSLQSGLIHSTRVGDMDCDIYSFLEHEGLSQEEIHAGLADKGGLLGISGVSGDVRYIQEAADGGNERAKLALDVFVNGIVHYIGAFYVDLGGLDYLVFTAGIGENSARIREMVCGKLSALGVMIDAGKNEAVRGEAEITADGSRVRVLVIPTDEELGIARRAYKYIKG